MDYCSAPRVLNTPSALPRPSSGKIRELRCKTPGCAHGQVSSAVEQAPPLLLIRDWPTPAALHLVSNSLALHPGAHPKESQMQEGGSAAWQYPAGRRGHKAAVSEELKGHRPFCFSRGQETARKASGPDTLGALCCTFRRPGLQHLGLGSRALQGRSPAPVHGSTVRRG